jgi:putative FmdB family regulatory protein
MPTYEYKCPEGHLVTVQRSLSDPESFPVCGECHEPMKRVFTAPPVVFNGTGWAGKPDAPQG